MNIHTANSFSARPEATTGERARRPKPVRLTGRRPADVRRWLEQQPSLDELSEVFPAEWRDAQHDVADILANQHHDGAADAIARLQTPLRRNRSGPVMRREQQQMLVAARTVRRSRTHSAPTTRAATATTSPPSRSLSQRRTRAPSRPPIRMRSRPPARGRLRRRTRACRLHPIRGRSRTDLNQQ